MLPSKHALMTLDCLWPLSHNTMICQKCKTSGQFFEPLYNKINILTEHGYVDISRTCAQCNGFKCAAGTITCCCQRVLFNKPDFVAVELSLQTLCHLHGVQVMFLLRLHCELNPIKQCWRICKKEMPGVPEIIKGEQSSAQCHHNPHIEIDWFTNHLCCTALHGNSHIFSPRFANHSL